jgi:hypothetical protein
VGGGAHTHIIRSLCVRIHPAPPPVRGILRKSEIQGPVSFASIKTPTWVNVEVLTPRPMTMQLHIADGRQLQARVPAGNAPYFHVRIPKRPNLFLSAQLPLTVEAARATGALPLVGLPGKKRKRGRRTNELRVCKHCRLLQRGRQDKKKVATTAVATPASTAQNRYRIQQYQAGALNQGVHMVPRRGSADHWCGLQPCSDSHKLYGPHFLEILRARLIKRPARNKSMDAFTKLSAHLAGLPLLPKRVTNTHLKDLFEKQFRRSSCARAVQRQHELCHRAEAAGLEEHEVIMRKWTTGVWTSDEKPIPAAGRFLHVRALSGRFLETTSDADPTEEQWQQRSTSLVYQRKSMTLFTWRLKLSASTDTVLVWKTELSRSNRAKAIRRMQRMHNVEWSPEIRWTKI